MDAILDSIRIAVADGASDDDRTRGAAACRALAEALDGAMPPSEMASTEPPAGAVAPPAPVGAEVPAPTAAAAAAAVAVITEPVTTALVPVTTALAPAPVTPWPVASNPFAGMTADQILDLAIAKLRVA